MEYVQSNVLQEAILMFKGKEKLFNWIIFHGNNLQMFAEGLNIVGGTYFDWHNVLTLLKKLSE